MAMVGIDLGTTHSLVGVWRDGQCQLLPNALGETLTPSVVGMDDDGQIISGRLAMERLQTHPELTIANFKRYMGTSRTFNLGKQQFRAEQLSALILKSLKQDAEVALGMPVTHAVISVPAYFNDAQRKATRMAGQLAGLAVDRLVNEPTAAAIAYGLHTVEDGSTFLVFDLGGGTFDISILELFSGVMQVHAAAGDNYLGGEDFTEIMASLMVDQLGLDRKAIDATAHAILRKQAEHCKKFLTDQNQVTQRFSLKHESLEFSVDRETYRDACEGLMTRLRAPITRALRDANLSVAQIDAIVLVGGATRMPMIRSLTAKMLGKIPLMTINPDEVVAMGAGILTGLMQNDASLSEIVLTDVSPYTLGIEVINRHGHRNEGGLYHPIIERNSPVPVSRVDTFSTAADYQTSITVNVFQGESRLVKDNVKLGAVVVNVPSKPAGEESIDVRFTYDINGLLEVEVLVASSGLKKRAVIEGNPGIMTPEEIDAALVSLATLKIHPREKIENSVLIARGERLYEELLGDLREYVATLLVAFDRALQRQNLDEIAGLREKLEAEFDAIEASLA